MIIDMTTSPSLSPTPPPPPPLFQALESTAFPIAAFLETVSVSASSCTHIAPGRGRPTVFFTSTEVFQSDSNSCEHHSEGQFCESRRDQLTVATGQSPS